MDSLDVSYRSQSVACLCLQPSSLNSISRSLCLNYTHLLSVLGANQAHFHFRAYTPIFCCSCNPLPCLFIWLASSHYLEISSAITSSMAFASKLLVIKERLAPNYCPLDKSGLFPSWGLFILLQNILIYL